jgi:hypothetical protein
MRKIGMEILVRYILMRVAMFTVIMIGMLDISVRIQMLRIVMKIFMGVQMLVAVAHLFPIDRRPPLNFEPI